MRKYHLSGIAHSPFWYLKYHVRCLMSPPQRRIEDRIRELCAKALAETDGEALRELSELLHGTIKHMRMRATSLLLEKRRLLEPRRRANDNGM